MHDQQETVQIEIVATAAMISIFCTEKAVKPTEHLMTKITNALVSNGRKIKILI